MVIRKRTMVTETRARPCLSVIKKCLTESCQAHLYCSCDPVGVVLAALRIPGPCATGDLAWRHMMCRAMPDFLCRNIQSVSKLPSCSHGTKTPGHSVRRIMFSCDPVGIRESAVFYSKILCFTGSFGVS